jgi:hypothetical protein
MSERVFGPYCVKTGKELGVEKGNPGYFRFYVLREDLKCMGQYDIELLAVTLAKGLYERDQELLSQEIDKILEG